MGRKIENGFRVEGSGLRAAVLAIALVIAANAAFAAEDADKYVEQGHQYYKAMKYGKAVGMYRKALALDPANETALKYCGYAYVRAGNYDTAIKYFNELYSISLDPKIKKIIDTLENRDEDKGEDGEKEKIYRNLFSVNVIPYIALFLNFSYEFSLADTIGIRLGAFTWSMVPQFSGVFAQIHFYPQSRGLSGWMFGGGLGTLQANLLPSVQGGYRWIFDSGFSMDLMLGTIFIESLTRQAFGEAGSLWPSVEFSLGIAF
jgi:hypothetical protein